MMRTGSRSGYWVVEWAGGFDPSLTDLVPRFPEMVVGHRIAIASCDSGPFVPTPDELEKGWFRQNEVAISPRLQDVSDLPMPGFDEWYVYDLEAPTDHIRSFVNRFGFAPLDEGNSETQDFWAQVERLRPLHVLGAGTPTMFFARRDETIYRRVCSV